MEQCPYSAYISYVDKDRGEDNVYSILGGEIHDILEKIMNCEATTDDIPGVLINGLEKVEELGLKFPKDFKGGDAIEKKWVGDMTHFAENFKKPKGDFSTEEFLIYKVDDDTYIQGYADLIRSNDDGTQSILDWKTSSLYRGDALEHAARQLIIYAMAKEQEGIEIDKIAWVFLKYVEITFMGKKRSNSKNETKITKVCNRSKLYDEMKGYVENDLEKAGYNDVEIELYLDDVKENGTLDTLPDAVKSKYTIKPYVLEYELNDKTRAETRAYIDKMVEEFRSRGGDSKMWEPRKLTKTNRYGKETDDTFFCNVLCNHRKKCKYIQEHNILRAAEKLDDDDLF